VNDDSKPDQELAAKPDIAAGSLAYMPKPAGQKSEGDNDFKIDKATEKKTLADIAPDLGSKPELKPSKSTKADGITVMVNGQPKKDAEAELQTDKKEHMEPDDRGSGDDTSNAKSKSADSVMPVKAALHETNDKAPAKPNVMRRSSKGPVILVVILLIVAGVFGYLWWSGNVKVADLTKQVKDLVVTKDKLNSQLQDASSNPSPTTPASSGATSGIRSIPELGLTYGLTDNTKKVTYSYAESSDSAGVVHSQLLFSSTTLVAAERKVVKDGKSLCLAGEAPLGSLVSYKGTETVPSGIGTGKFSDLKVDNKVSFKIGETYYLYVAPQASCSTDKTVQAVQTSDRVFVTELLASLAVSK